MAVKIAAAMGAEVTVLSQSLKKQEDGLRLGADALLRHQRPGHVRRSWPARFDLIVNTVSAPIDVDAYLSLLAVDGALVNVGAPAEPLSLDVFSLIGGRRTFAGSMIGGIAETQEMLDFCAEHGIGAEVEVIAADRVNEAYERVLASDVRYRFVIDAAPPCGDVDARRSRGRGRRRHVGAAAGPAAARRVRAGRGHVPHAHGPSSSSPACCRRSPVTSGPASPGTGCSSPSSRPG